MKNRWSEKDAAKCQGDPLQLRVYTSRLLGQEPDLVLHGGGNTSVKTSEKNIFNETEELLYVKGSGWDLATIESAGFAPVRLDILKKMAGLPQLSDAEMVRLQRSAMPDPNAPTPSVEAILHAIIPFQYVDHTHADAVVTLTNTPDGERRVRALYGDRMLILPYVMPGFILAKHVHQATRGLDWSRVEGMILLHHGVFSFSDDARESYERMLRFVSQAEDYLDREARQAVAKAGAGSPDLLGLARLRRSVSRARGAAQVTQWDRSPEAAGFAGRQDARALSQRGPLTPDHVIRTKRTPVFLDQDPEQAVEKYCQDYQAYFDRHTRPGLTCLSSAPSWAVWPGQGLVAFGASANEAGIVADITKHTVTAIQRAEKLGGWQVLLEQDIFDMEYWELEQAKLRTNKKPAPLQGRVALVTGAARGIGRACVEALAAQGAAVAALDIDPGIVGLFKKSAILEIVCDVTDHNALQAAVAATVERFGGLDLLVCNAGIFPPTEDLENLKPETWNKSLAINLTSHQQLLQAAIPFLRLGIQASVVIIASKNVPAPGPGAAAYSVAKAGLTQLGRVAALELGPQGVRVNLVHPDAVFDTGIWTPEVLEQRAKRYGLSVAEYKTKNLLKVEITSSDVAALVATLAGPAFAKTTGAQIPIDGGNDRVI